MRILKGFLLVTMVLFMAAWLQGCGDSGSADTAWITLKPAEEPVYAVSGRILPETGGPETDLTEATVYLVVDGEETPAYETQPDGSGNYLFEGVQAGSYTVVVMGLAGYADNDDTDIEVVDADVTVGDITMLYGFTVSGQILFETLIHNDPVSGIWAIFTQQLSPTESDSYAVFIGEEGNYITPVMEYGQWTMALALDEDGERTFYEDATPIDLTSGNVADHDVSLKDNAVNITGYVSYGTILFNELPQPGAFVELRGDANALLGQSDSDADAEGFYRIILAENEMPVSLVNWKVVGVYADGYSSEESLDPAAVRINRMDFRRSDG